MKTLRGERKLRPGEEREADHEDREPHRKFFRRSSAIEIDHCREEGRRPADVEQQATQISQAPDATVERPKQFQWIHDFPPMLDLKRAEPARCAIALLYDVELHFGDAAADHAELLGGCVRDVDHAAVNKW